MSFMFLLFYVLFLLYLFSFVMSWWFVCSGLLHPGLCTPNLPTKTIPTKIRRLKTSGEFPLDMRAPPLNIKILLESNPPESRILVRRLAVPPDVREAARRPLRRGPGRNVYIYIYTYQHILISYYCSCYCYCYYYYYYYS